jgi:hypothetical protein
MASVFEIPLIPSTPQKLHISLSGTDYTLSLSWNTVSAVWLLDIADTNEVPILSGVPLVTGVDILSQYKYFGIPGSIVVQGSGNPDNVPTFDTLGTTSHVFWIG